jgi:hypothetical protein
MTRKGSLSRISRLESRISQTFSIGVLGLVSGVTDSLVKRMRFRANHVAAHRNFRKTPAASPFLYRRDELPTDSAAAVPLPDNQSADFATAARFENLLFRRVGPTDDFARFRDENDVVFALQDSVQPGRDLFRLNRITERAAEFRHGGGIVGRGSSDVHLAHRGSNKVHDTDWRRCRHFELLCRGALP